MFERSSRPNRHLGEAPQQTSDEQVLDIIASAGLVTSSIPVVQEREQALRAGDDALSLELRRTGESGFREAMRAASLVMLGLFFVGIGLGVVIHSLGFPWWLAPLLPGVLFAGSVEFVLLTMMTAGASLVSVAVMTLLINSRHLMYGLSYPIERVHGSLAKFYTVYTLIDEAFALNSGSERHTLRGSRILWIHAGMHMSVILSSTLGFFLGSSFLVHLEGFDFVMTALFTVLALDAYRANPDRLTVLFSVIAAAAALIIAPGSMLLVAMAVYMALLVGRYAAAKKRGSLPQHMLVADELTHHRTEHDRVEETPHEPAQ